VKIILTVTPADRHSNHGFLFSVTPRRDLNCKTPVTIPLYVVFS